MSESLGRKAFPRLFFFRVRIMKLKYYLFKIMPVLFLSGCQMAAFDAPLAPVENGVKIDQVFLPACLIDKKGKMTHLHTSPVANGYKVVPTDNLKGQHLLFYVVNFNGFTLWHFPSKITAKKSLIPTLEDNADIYQIFLAEMVDGRIQLLGLNIDRLVQSVDLGELRAKAPRECLPTQAMKDMTSCSDNPNHWVFNTTTEHLKQYLLHLGESAFTEEFVHLFNKQDCRGL
ncbi:hypothetical protein Mmc1_1383 [Magnetococcus marinus MC-1]|uniref:Lipoprotein n=2 Tax=Magnetococcus TaxID=162171 RepID=A0L7F1_MAGMM|nr:hypothetical protein Mmc1_1383 [Magnetococcus marinus MC-1]